MVRLPLPLSLPVSGRTDHGRGLPWGIPLSIQCTRQHTCIHDEAVGSPADLPSFIDAMVATYFLLGRLSLSRRVISDPEKNLFMICEAQN